jgi:hypothetical protein
MSNGWRRHSAVHTYIDATSDAVYDLIANVTRTGERSTVRVACTWLPGREPGGSAPTSAATTVRRPACAGAGSAKYRWPAGAGSSPSVPSRPAGTTAHVTPVSGATALSPRARGPVSPTSMKSS